MTKQLGVIGYPLSHTLSPVFQQAALDHHGIPVTYTAWPTPPERLGETVDRLRGPKYMGFNITIPHKEQLLDLVDEVDEMARSIGAVNTVVNRDGTLSGYNTDAYGFVKSLKEKANFDPLGKTVLLLGAGGAARAAAYALAAEGVERLTIANRTAARAKALAEDVGRLLPNVHVSSLQNVSGDADLIVNSTSVGMASGDGAGQTPLGADSIPEHALAYDMVYTPAETPFLRCAQEAGARVVGGLWMLIYQGASSFELWSGKDAPVDVMYQAAQQAIE